MNSDEISKLNEETKELVRIMKLVKVAKITGIAFITFFVVMSSGISLLLVSEFEWLSTFLKAFSTLGSLTFFICTVLMYENIKSGKNGFRIPSMRVTKFGLIFAISINFIMFCWNFVQLFNVRF